MTLNRIMKRTNERGMAGDGVALRVCGRFGGEHVDTCAELIGEEKCNVGIDLIEPIGIDRAGVRLLALTEANEIELRNGPAYLRVRMAGERLHPKANQSGPNAGELDAGDL